MPGAWRGLSSHVALKTKELLGTRDLREVYIPRAAGFESI